MLQLWHPQPFNRLRDIENWLDLPNRNQARWTDGEDAINLNIDLPGADTKSITVEVLDKRVTVTAKRGESAYTQTFALACDVDAKKSTAHYKNGVLEVSLAKPEHVKPKRIPVTTAKVE